MSDSNNRSHPRQTATHPFKMPLMNWKSLLFLLAAGSVCLWGNLEMSAVESEKAAKATESNSKAGPRALEGGNKTAEALAELARQSVVVISHFGRAGEEDGVGAGFVVSSDGLIATCLHVIGEARPIVVRLANGKKYDVTEVHAWDRKLDLAVIRIDANDLPALPLGDSDSLKQGASVVAMGNPLGMEQSIVEGVVSARRDIDGVEMIQLAIPIEEGNSGGPLLDLAGRVHGLLTLKSALSANLGFATPINSLKLLLKRPASIPMKRWLTIGALNPREWTPVMGARWSQKAGHIQVEGLGQGFGGRALCLNKKSVPPRPYELAVTVRLDDEAGAAGLVFESNGDQVHYGFYPTGGNLRLTRFNGPDVFTWTILKDVHTPHYRPGDWNRLRVRIEDDAIRCWVNEQLVIESDDHELRGGKVGLAKFRNTRAAFKNFQIGTNLLARSPAASAGFADEILSKINLLSGAPDPRLASQLQSNPEASRALLTDRARALERQAAGLRELAATVHRRSVQGELVKLMQASESQIDLFRATMLLAKLDNPELEIDAYQHQVSEMADEIRASLPNPSDDATKLAALKKFLFVENGFHGSRSDYYNRANDYLSNVIDDREGKPITLSVLFLELGHRIGLDNIAGVSLPGHFIVKFTPKDGEEQFIDVFEEGKTLSLNEAKEIVTITGRPFMKEYLRAATKREIIVRMLRNLFHVTKANAEMPSDALRYLNIILALDEDSAGERLDRALLRARTGDRIGAKEDLQWLLDKEPPGIDLSRIRELFRSL